MAELSIPKQFWSGFEKLKSLNEDSFKTLLQVLKKEQPALFRQDFADHVASNLPNLSPEDLKDIINTLIGFCWGRESSGLSSSEFVDQVVAQNCDEKDPQRDLLKRYLPLLLDVEPLIVTSKAFDILTEHQFTIHDLRIITDLRPIFKEGFTEEPASLPAAAVITHTLKIAYHKGRQVEEFFLALDDQDIELLRALLDRAEAKEKSLKILLEKSKVPFITSGGE